MRTRPRYLPIARYEAERRLAQVRVRIGAPLQPPKPAADPEAEKRQAREFTEHVMASIAALSGQTRADVDAAEHKKSLSGQR